LSLFSAYLELIQRIDEEAPPIYDFSAAPGSTVPDAVHENGFPLGISASIVLK
jgi:hypothetical protein